MAMNQRDVPITRAHIHEWLSEYDGQIRATKKMEEFLRGKLGVVADQKVNTVAHDDLGDTTTVLQMVLMDIESYGH